MASVLTGQNTKTDIQKSNNKQSRSRFIQDVNKCGPSHLNTRPYPLH